MHYVPSTYPQVFRQIALPFVADVNPLLSLTQSVKKPNV